MEEHTMTGLLTMAALLLHRMDQLANRDWDNQFEVGKIRKEAAELDQTWQLVMSELRQQHRDSQKSAKAYARGSLASNNV